MDIATILGVITGFSLMIAAILLGGGLTWFINVPSLMIVVGGTIGVTLINYPLGTVLGVMGVLKNALFHKEIATAESIKRLVEFSRVARREGILALQSLTKDMQDPFLVKGINLAIDGLEPQVIGDILDIEVENLENRHNCSSLINKLVRLAVRMELKNPIRWKYLISKVKPWFTFGLFKGLSGLSRICLILMI